MESGMTFRSHQQKYICIQKFRVSTFGVGEYIAAIRKKLGRKLSQIAASNARPECCTIPRTESGNVRSNEISANDWSRAEETYESYYSDRAVRTKFENPLESRHTTSRRCQYSTKIHITHWAISLRTSSPLASARKRAFLVPSYI